ncbi:hypothetical protein ACVMVB_16905 [Stenotrophomonas maltophilia]
MDAFSSVPSQVWQHQSAVDDPWSGMLSGVVGRACYDELKLIHEVVMALKEARVKDKNSLAIDFSERVGVPIDRRYLYDFFDAMNARVKGEG